MGARALLLAALCVQALQAHCPRLCDCKWKGGKESVLCPSANLTRLPTRLDAGTQLLDLTDNPLSVIPRDAFVAAGLLNLQKVYVAKCRLKNVDRFAFRKLINLVELDLSHNLLSAVPSHVFDSVPELRELKLSGNPIQRIANEAFSGVPQLVRLELSECRLGTVEPRAFGGLENGLEWLKLDRNRLSDVRSSTITSLKSLHGLELANNPWNCTCGLRPLREWMLRQNVPFGTPPACRFPSRLAGKPWDRMELDEFACAPEIDPMESESNAEEGDNVTLSCKILGEPAPKVFWLSRNRVLANSSSAGGRRAYLLKSRGGFASLTVVGAEPQDSGQYTCAAENLAGRAEAVVKLAVAKRGGSSGGGGLALAAGATAALLVLAVCLLVLSLKAARGKPRARPPTCARHRSDSYEKIEMNHKFDNRVSMANNFIANEVAPLRMECSVGVTISAARKRGDYRHVPSQDTEDEAETYDEEMETPTPTPTGETASGVASGWRTQHTIPWPERREEPKIDDTDLHIPRLSEYRETRLDLTPDSLSSCGQSFSLFNTTDSQNKVNNNTEEGISHAQALLRRRLPPVGGVRLYGDAMPSSATALAVDEQNNLSGDPDKNYPDLLEINNLNANQPPEPTRRKLPVHQSTENERDNYFFTLPRKGNVNIKNGNVDRYRGESNSRSPLLPESRYGSSGGENSITSDSVRRPSIDTARSRVVINGNVRSNRRSNSFLNLASPTGNIGSPQGPTPLLEIRGLPGAELARTPLAAPAPSLPLTYDYHAAQLERFLEEYRSLQEQLCKMKETCENISGTRERPTSGTRFSEQPLFDNCTLTPSDDGMQRPNIKNRPSVAVTSMSGTLSSGSPAPEGASALSIGSNDLATSLSSWTSNNSLMKRLSGSGDFFRS